MGIMKGVEDNKFAPKDNYTTEQAIVTLVRVYDNFNGSAKAIDGVIGGADVGTDIVVEENNIAG